MLSTIPTPKKYETYHFSYVLEIKRELSKSEAKALADFQKIMEQYGSYTELCNEMYSAVEQFYGIFYIVNSNSQIYGLKSVSGGIQDAAFIINQTRHTPKTINVTVPLNLELSRLSNLLCCALEGGSNYWYQEMQLNIGKEQYFPSRGQLDFYDKFFFAEEGEAVLCISPDAPDEVPLPEGKEYFELTRSSFITALQLMAEKTPWHFSNYLTDNADAETGDVFLQYACFGEIIYG